VENQNKFKTFRNLYNKLVRASKRLFYCEGLHAARKNPKKTWDLINSALNRPSVLPKVEELKVNNVTVINPTEIANTFTEAGVNIANSVNETSVPPEEFLGDTLAPEFQLGRTSPAEIVNIIRYFESKSSSDIHGISVGLLKEIAIEISFPLAHIFNLSLETGTFPEALKRSRIVPVHKQGDKANCDNYRPIALLSSLSKIRFVAIKLVNHLELNKPLHSNQFGFQRGKSTEQNLTKALNIISSALNNGNFCIGIFIDLRKAFDICSHSILLKNLNILELKIRHLHGSKATLKIENNKLT
jgi:hypothetical protein